MFARHATAIAAAAALSFVAQAARATPRWVDRRLTLPGPVAGTLDLAGSLAHADEDVGNDGPCGYCSFTGTGVNVEGVLGIASRVDSGLRVGFRGFDDNLPAPVNEGAVADADSYARMYDPLSFWGGYGNLVWGNGAVSNPELRVRVRILDVKRVFELGVEARGVFPFANGTVFTQTVGVPMALHLGRYVRFDFGGYSHFVFRGQPGGVIATFEAPAAFWFQVHRRVFLGPMFGFRWYSDNVYASGPQNFDFSVGFGVGVSLAKFLDLKTQIYLPRVDDAAHYIGAGVGVSFYFD